jgi:hypothetical protein
VGDIIGVFLITGEEVLGRKATLSADDVAKGYCLAVESPYKLVLMPTGQGMRPAFLPLLISRKNNKLFLRQSDFISETWEPDDGAQKGYMRETTGLEIATPNAGLHVAN